MKSYFNRSYVWAKASTFFHTASSMKVPWVLCAVVIHDFSAELSVYQVNESIIQVQWPMKEWSHPIVYISILISTPNSPSIHSHALSFSGCISSISFHLHLSSQSSSSSSSSLLTCQNLHAQKISPIQTANPYLSAADCEISGTLSGEMADLITVGIPSSNSVAREVSPP